MVAAWVKIIFTIATYGFIGGSLRLQGKLAEVPSLLLCKRRLLGASRMDHVRPGLGCFCAVFSLGVALILLVGFLSGFLYFTRPGIVGFLSIGANSFVGSLIEEYLFRVLPLPSRVPGVDSIGEATGVGAYSAVRRPIVSPPPNQHDDNDPQLEVQASEVPLVWSDQRWKWAVGASHLGNGHGVICNVDFTVQEWFMYFDVFFFMLFHLDYGHSFVPGGEVFTDWRFMFICFVMGVCTTQIYKRTGSVWLCLLMHWLPVWGWLTLLGGLDRMTKLSKPV